MGSLLKGAIYEIKLNFQHHFSLGFGRLVFLLPDEFSTDFH